MGLTNLPDGGVERFLHGILPNGTNRWVALFTSEPSDLSASGGTEVSDGSYARVLHTSWSVRHSLKRIENSGDITFPAFAGDVTGVVAWGIMDASTLGNVLTWGYVTHPDGVAGSFDYPAGARVRFLDGELFTSVVVC